MLRYMISPIIGNGSSTENPFRAAVSDVSNVNVAAVIPTNLDGTPETNPDYGKPKHNFCFCQVATSSIAPVAAVSNSFVFPDYNLDGRMDGMEASTRTGMVQSLEAYDLDGQGLNFIADHGDADSYRQFLRSLVQQVEPTFGLDNLIVAEVAA